MCASTCSLDEATREQLSLSMHIKFQKRKTGENSQTLDWIKK